MKFRKEVILAAGLLFSPLAFASDHADTAMNANRMGGDLTDLFIFPSPADATKVVMVMDVHGLIPAGQLPNFAFDPGVLYQFKIDNTGDYVEDLVIQARFSGTGLTQKVLIAGPYKPLTTGTTTVFANPRPVLGTINTPFTIPVSATQTMSVFAGLRSDPFFFDLNRFFAIFPDRATPLTGTQVDNPNGIMGANTPQLTSFRGFPAGSPSGYDTSPASDLLASLNVGSIIIELPRAMLSTGKIGVWMTTSIAAAPPGFNFKQLDRLARPAINEVLATVTANRHLFNDSDNPTDDRGATALYSDIVGFMAYPAGRSSAIAAALAGVLTPDVMTADMSKTTIASYLGIETGGFTGGTFGGRKLTDDVVDIDLGAIFGNVVPALGLALDDGKEIPSLTTDNIGPHTDLLATFPYLGLPH